jgi:hypothetical protein
MVQIDKTSLVRYIEAVTENYPLEVNVILVESKEKDCFLLKEISYLTKEEIGTSGQKFYDELILHMSEKEYIGRTTPVKSTKENVRKLIENKEVIRGILHAHTWQERVRESPYPWVNYVLRSLYNLKNRLKKPKMKRPELSPNDIRDFGEIIQPYAKKPVYYGILYVPNPPSREVILKELNERLLFFEKLEDREILTGFTIKG